MLSRIQSKIGTAGLVVAIVALVAALTGAAFAAGGLTKSQEKQVKKIAKQFAGKRGPKGATGATGLQGPKGDAGAKGETGPEGKEGKEGKAGKNGVDGEDGEAGVCSQANPTCVLPAGATETGIWASTGSGFQYVPMSFNIPLPSAPTEINFVKENGKELGAGGTEQTPVNCLGTVQDPKAKAGHVCLYAHFEFGLTYVGEGSGTPDLFKTGALTSISFPSGGAAAGTWAVTAPTS